MTTGRFTTRSEGETRALASRLGGELSAGTTVLLSGDLGSGKTAFAKGLAESLGIDPTDVTSPTFTLVHEYRGGRLPFIHVDLYRLDRADIDEIGLDPELASQGIVAIEWAERLAHPLQRPIVVRIEDDGDDRRTIEIRPQG